MKSAVPAVQKDSKGTSDSKELPLMTNAGTARNANVAQTG